MILQRHDGYNLGFQLQAQTNTSTSEQPRWFWLTLENLQSELKQTSKPEVRFQIFSTTTRSSERTWCTSDVAGSLESLSSNSRSSWDSSFPLMMEWPLVAPRSHLLHSKSHARVHTTRYGGKIHTHLLDSSDMETLLYRNMNCNRDMEWSINARNVCSTSETVGEGLKQSGVSDAAAFLRHDPFHPQNSWQYSAMFLQRFWRHNSTLGNLWLSINQAFSSRREHDSNLVFSHCLALWWAVQ